MSRNGIMLPNALQQQPMLQVAAPLNDVQLVAQLSATLIAGKHDLSAVDAVNMAHDILAESVRRQDCLGRKIRQAVEGQ